MAAAFILILAVSAFIIIFLSMSFVGARKSQAIYEEFLSNPPKWGKLLQSKEGKVFGRVKGNGKHTIVIETGAGSICAEWFETQDRLAANAKVVVYNRPGYPWSEKPKTRRNPKNIAIELRQMLTNEGLEPPFIIAGHSLGGMIANVFARLYPSDTQAVVFIDATHPDHRRFEELGPSGKKMSVAGKIMQMRFFKLIINAGFVSLFSAPLKILVQMMLPNASDDLKDEALRGYKSSGVFDALADELESIIDSSVQFQLLPKFPNIPLRIICHNPQADVMQMIGQKVPQNDAEGIEKLWQELDSSFLTYSSKARRTVSEKAGHLIHIEDPDIIEKEIIDLIENL